MSEKRKPILKIVAQKRGKKRVRIELFEASLWRMFGLNPGKRFRVRVNGKWVNGDKSYTLTEVMRQLRSMLKKR